MSLTLNGISGIRHFERCNMIEIRNGIIFDFYMGLLVQCTFLPDSFHHVQPHSDTALGVVLSSL